MKLNYINYFYLLIYYILYYIHYNKYILYESVIRENLPNLSGIRYKCMYLLLLFLLNDFLSNLNLRKVTPEMYSKTFETKSKYNLYIGH